MARKSQRTTENTTHGLLTLSKILLRFFSVKSVITLIVVIGYTYITIKSGETLADYTEITKTIIIFYFGVQAGKRDD